MATKTAKQVMGEIETAATEHSAELRMVRTIEVGQFVRQGDVYLQRVESKKPAKSTEIKDRQLAPGNTPGSRHVVEGDVKLYKPAGADPLVGPTIVAPERFTLTHPEHAHVSLPSGQYACTFQRDFMQEERARVQD